MEILSTSDESDSKSAKRPNSSPGPLRSFRLPSLEMPLEPSRPVEQLPAKPLRVPEGVLWVSHAEQERHRDIVEVRDKDDDDDTGTTKKKKSVSVPTEQAAEHEIPIEGTLLQPPQETAIPRPAADTEAYRVTDEAEIPAGQEVFTYPEAPSHMEWEPVAAEYATRQYTGEGGSFASPEPLPPIAGFEANGPYPAADDAEESPQPPPIPMPRKPLYSTVNASAGSSPNPNFGSAPNFNAAPNTPPPPPAQTGPGGGGPPMPPFQPPGAAGFNMPAGGPGGPGAFGGNFNAMPAAPMANPNVAPSVNPNVNVALPYNPNRTADWTARVIGLAGFISSRRTRRKLNKRIDKFEATNKRAHGDMTDEQLRVRKEQHRQDRDINRLRTDQTRLTNENQHLRQGQRFETPPPAPQLVNTEQQQQEVTQQQGVELQPDERIVQDTWYRSVVDRHGRVRHDAMQYGEGFRQEQQKEAIQDRTAATATPGATLGAGAGFGATQSVGQMGGGGGPQAPYGAQPSAPVSMPYQNNQLPSGMTAPTLQQGQPIHIDPQHQLRAHAETKKTVSGVAFWVMLAVIIAAFFVAALI